MKDYFVYILTNFSNSVLYIGITNDMLRRIYEHKNELVVGFTKKYHVHKLVYLEQCTCVIDAIQREKQLKGWNRKKKEDLINESNPEWRDLSKDFFG